MAALIKPATTSSFLSSLFSSFIISAPCAHPTPPTPHTRISTNAKVKLNQPMHCRPISLNRTGQSRLPIELCLCQARFNTQSRGPFITQLCHNRATYLNTSQLTQGFLWITRLRYCYHVIATYLDSVPETSMCDLWSRSRSQSSWPMAPSKVGSPAPI